MGRVGMMAAAVVIAGSGWGNVGSSAVVRSRVDCAGRGMLGASAVVGEWLYVIPLLLRPAPAPTGLSSLRCAKVPGCCSCCHRRYHILGRDLVWLVYLCPLRSSCHSTVSARSVGRRCSMHLRTGRDP